MGTLVIGLALVLAGCGGDGERREAYVRGINVAQQRFATTVERLSAQITPTSSARSDRRTLGRYRRAVDRVVGELRAITPPAGVRDLHGRLIGALAGFGTTVDTATRALDERDPARVRATQRRLERATADASAQIERAIGAINRELPG